MGLADTFKALSDPQRRTVLELLKDGRKTAGELAEELNISPAAFMPFLDSRIPIHYDGSGNVDDYGSKYT